MSWAEQAANRLRVVQVEKDVAFEEHKLRRALSPGLWSELRTWLRDSCEELNARTGGQILAFEISPSDQATVIRLKSGKPIAKLKIEFSVEAQRVEYSCGAGKGQYLFGVNLSDSSVYLTDSYHRLFTVEEVGSTLLDKLLESQF